MHWETSSPVRARDATASEIERTEPSLTASWPLSHSARAFAFSQWALQRSDSVSNPWMSWKALNGAMQPPMSLSVLTRASKMKTRLQASTPKIGWFAKSPPWYDSCGPATRGYFKLPSAFLTRQSNDEPSTMMPPIDVPWPPIHFVADSTTISAPQASGLQVQPPCPKVLSHTIGMELVLAISTYFSKSGTVEEGLEIVSR